MKKPDEHCDVAGGLCGAWQKHKRWGSCCYYDEMKLWIEPSLKKRIIQCKHRQKMNKLVKLLEGK